MEYDPFEFEFRVIGRVDVKKLLKEWKKKPGRGAKGEPTAGWRLKFSYVFEHEICALLFESEAGGGTACYRALFYREEEGEFRQFKKTSFRETDGFRVDAIGVNEMMTALFICHSNEEQPCGVRCRRFSRLPDGELVDMEVRFRSRYFDTVLPQSRHAFPLTHGGKVLFVRAPSGRQVEFLDDMHDFSFRVGMLEPEFPDRRRKRRLMDYLREDGEPETEGDGKLPPDGDPGTGDQDGKKKDEPDEKKEDDNDDTKCSAEVRQAPAAGKSAEQELRELVGLSEIKEKVEQITAFARLRKLAKEQGRQVEAINLNLSFLGNPGTAKTTVARLFARIMKENDVLSKGDLVEVGRSDLVAKYTGQTAIKVKEVFKKAEGNVLFIDEAYSLVDYWENEYGDEAIATIVQEMENRRDDMIVIFAGYPDKMEQFLSRNPGLRSRVPFTVTFRDYTAEELTEIAKSEAARRGYALSAEAEGRIREICSSAMMAEEFGNGRFSRNLVESAIMRSACRTVAGLPAGADLSACFTLEGCDFTAPDNLKKKDRKTIGFSVA